MPSWNSGLPADTSKIRLSAAMLRNNELSMQNVISLSSLTADLPYLPYATSPTPAPIWVYLDIAPTGWLIMGVPPTDSLLAVKGGPTYITGGTTVGTWSGPPHTLVYAELPGLSPSIAAFVSSVAAFPIVPVPGGAHSHDYSAIPQTRPMGSVGILIVKVA